MKLTSDELTSICPDPIIGVDNNGVINVFNPAAEKLLGFRAKDTIHLLKITELYEEEKEARVIKKLLMSNGHGEIGQIEGYETRIIAQDGRVIPIRLSATILRENGNILGSIGFFHDQTSRFKLEEKLRELSRTDHLTGMLNSRQFHTTLSEEVIRSVRYQRPFSLICVDLDNFKQVNDCLGHLEGDEVLKLVGIVAQVTLRENDTGYRYGGDEFMVICPETDYSGAGEVAERLRATFAKLLPGILDTGLDKLPKPVSMSAGVTVFYGGNQVGVSELIRQADMTMYLSKTNGGNQVSRFEATTKVTK